MIIWSFSSCPVKSLKYYLMSVYFLAEINQKLLRIVDYILLNVHECTICFSNNVDILSESSASVCFDC